MFVCTLALLISMNIGESALADNITSYWNMSTRANMVNQSFAFSGGKAGDPINVSSGCILGNCTQFDGTLDAYSFGADHIFTASNNWTISFWTQYFRSTVMRDVMGNGGGNGYISFRTEQDDVWVQNVNGFVRFDDIGVDTAGAGDEYEHLHFFTFVSFTNGTCRLYINGSFIQKRTLNGGSSAVTLDTMGDGSNNPWNGTLDEVSYWKRALSPAEVSGLFENYTSGQGYPFISGGAPSNPSVHFPGNDDIIHYNNSPTTVLNITITDGDGDAMNVTWYNGTDKGVICTNNTNIASGSSVTCSWNGRSSSSVNEWYVNITDGVFITKSPTYNFTIRGKAIPNITQHSPLNGTIFQAGTTGVTLNLTYFDSNGDKANITFINNATGGVICANESTSNNTQVTCRWTGLQNNTEYCWYGHALDTGDNDSVDNPICFVVDSVNANCWWYQLNITFIDSDFENHTQQPVTFNITGLNGTNKEILKVLYNDSGSWSEQPWEWFHERYNLTDNYYYHNHTIRFLVNATNNTPQENYWIVSCNNASYIEKNETIFLWYDGFERGTTTGWNDDGCTWGLSSKRSAVGNGSLNYSAGAHNEVYWDFNFTVDNYNLYLCFFTQLNDKTPAGAESFPIMLQNVTPSYDGNTWNRQETWWYDKALQGDRRPQTIQLYNYTEARRLVYNTTQYIYEDWESWCWKVMDTTDGVATGNGSAEFWRNNLNVRSGSEDWFSTGDTDALANTWWYDITTMNTVNPLPAGGNNLSVMRLEEIDGISLSSTTGATGFELLIDEIYLSWGHDFYMYNITPTINRLAPDFVPGEINGTPTITINSPPNNTDFANGTTWVILNVTIFDSDSMNLTFYNGSGGILHNNATIPAGTLNYTFNWSGLPHGVHYWYVNVTDGNTMNWTGNVSFIINATPIFRIILNYPANASTNQPLDTPFNVTVFTNGTNVNTSFYWVGGETDEENSYNCVGNWTNCVNTVDEDWATQGYISDNAHQDTATLYENFTLPSSLLKTVNITVKASVNNIPDKINFSCWNYSGSSWALIEDTMIWGLFVTNTYNISKQCYENQSQVQMMYILYNHKNINSVALYETKLDYKPILIYNQTGVSNNTDVTFIWENRTLNTNYSWYINLTATNGSNYVYGDFFFETTNETAPPILYFDWLVGNGGWFDSLNHSINFSFTDVDSVFINCTIFYNSLNLSGEYQRNKEYDLNGTLVSGVNTFIANCTDNTNWTFLNSSIIMNYTQINIFDEETRLPFNITKYNATMFVSLNSSRNITYENSNTSQMLSWYFITLNDTIRGIRLAIGTTYYRGQTDTQGLNNVTFFMYNSSEHDSSQILFKIDTVGYDEPLVLLRPRATGEDLITSEYPIGSDREVNAFLLDSRLYNIYYYNNGSLTFLTDLMVSGARTIHLTLTADYGDFIGDRSTYYGHFIANRFSKPSRENYTLVATGNGGSYSISINYLNGSTLKTQAFTGKGTLEYVVNKSVYPFNESSQFIAVFSFADGTVLRRTVSLGSPVLALPDLGFWNIGEGGKIGWSIAVLFIGLIIMATFSRFDVSLGLYAGAGIISLLTWASELPSALHTIALLLGIFATLKLVLGRLWS